MPAPELRLETVIDAPPERVWAALTDFASWDEWNPTLLQPSGPPVAGTEVRMKLRLGRLTVPMRQEIRVVDPPRKLVWRSRQAVPAALDVVRTFEIHPLEGGRSRLVQSEVTTGWLARLEVFLFRKPILKGYQGIARGLAQHVAAG
ncbi:MAG: SRPBCC domain-containing protein [Actinomycetota bacterium]|nr:SRPBCC domain-containing protein [Actinomycetota bacterium]